MIVITEDMLHSISKTENELKTDLACWLYDKQTLSLGRAAIFCEKDYFDFISELGKRGISIMDEDSVLTELQERN